MSRSRKQPQALGLRQNASRRNEFQSVQAFQAAVQVAAEQAKAAAAPREVPSEVQRHRAAERSGKPAGC